MTVKHIKQLFMKSRDLALLVEKNHYNIIAKIVKGRTT
jgi:hypothetical protein